MVGGQARQPFGKRAKIWTSPASMADNAPAQAAARAHVPSTDQGSSSSSAAPPAASAAPRAADSRVAIASNALPPPKLKKSIWEPVDLPHRKAVQDFYNSKPVQYGVAAVILINFCFIVLEKEIDPYSSDVVPNVQKYATLWGRVDDVCNVLFIFELLINFYGNCWGPFVSSSWNYLDMLVVIIGITSLGRIQLPAGVSKIKVFRAFRILRLFKRVQSLNKILVALVRSIPGVMNAFIVMFIFMCIFAIIAVDAFRDFGAQGFYQTVQTYGARDAQWGQGSNMTIVMPFVEGSYVSTENFTYVDAITPRGFHYGQEYFGTFGRSLYTLFQVLTGESWSEMVVRPLIFGVMPENAFWVALFFTVYILLTQVHLGGRPPARDSPAHATQPPSRAPRLPYPRLTAHRLVCVRYPTAGRAAECRRRSAPR